MVVTIRIQGRGFYDEDMDTTIVFVADSLRNLENGLRQMGLTDDTRVSRTNNLTGATEPAKVAA